MTSRPAAITAARIVPPALLLILVMAGLRGAVGAPRIDGPLKAHGVIIGTGLGIVLGGLLFVTSARHLRARPPDGYQDLDTPAKLRSVLIAVLIAGLLADITAVLVGLHLKLFTPTRKLFRPPRGSGGFLPRPQHPRPANGVFAATLQVIVYGLLVLAVLVVIFAIARWARMLQPAAGLSENDEIAEETQTLRDAIEEGRRALRTFDDARLAIIACYAAMEQRLGERGAARSVAETPDELLARAVKAGIVHGAAPRTLTRLFYEARFSTHPMGENQRAGAQFCLEELAGMLGEPVSSP